ncbi:DUF3139 domain-containing protein [Paenibacillus sp. P32E]|uniref:DUF3139 domain-containing protein n=1 Tax=Paenibacillus sp. P32E TaxID=1349434 RepID=UPI0009393A8A|nr:DUF3139 domain-containing protein [Paenibacillus sp. P32E]OKP83675.1 hypothetical protein A3848_25665 [Paenibacillus sp. P32E]
MNRKRGLFIVLTILLAVILVGGYFFLTGLPQKKSEIANEVREYLINERSYSVDEIEKVQGVYSFKSDDYQATVRFKDEPNVNYTYEKIEGTYKLVETSNIHGNHIDETYNQ